MAVATRRRKKKAPEKHFEWRDGSRFPVKPDVAGAELERLAATSGDPIDNLKPRRVWEENRPEDAPLHPCFEWDDRHAAELYRDEQARLVIRSIRVVDDTSDDPEPQIQYVKVELPDVGRAYVPTAVVMSDADMRRQVLAEAVAFLNGARRRYEHLEELRPVFDALDRLNLPA